MPASKIAITLVGILISVTSVRHYFIYKLGHIFNLILGLVRNRIERNSHVVRNDLATVLIIRVLSLSTICSTVGGHNHLPYFYFPFSRLSLLLGNLKTNGILYNFCTKLAKEQIFSTQRFSSNR